MGNVLISLFSSRKFVLALVCLILLMPLVYLGRLTVDRYIDVVQTLVVALIAAIGVESAAEKWNAPPPPGVAIADSMKPPPKPPSIPPPKAA